MMKNNFNKKMFTFNFQQQLFYFQKSWLLGSNADKSAAGAGVVGGTQEQLAAWPMLMHPYLQDYWNGMDVSLKIYYGIFDTWKLI